MRDWLKKALAALAVVLFVLNGTVWYLPSEVIALLAVGFLLLAAPRDAGSGGAAPSHRIIRVKGSLQLATRLAGLAALVLLLATHLSGTPRIPLLELPPVEVVMAGFVLLIAVLVEAARYLGGVVVTIVAAFVAYALLGDGIEGALGHGAIAPGHFIDLMFFTTDGILGMPIAVATGTVVHFLLMVALLERLGAIAWFCRLSGRLAGPRYGGPAATAVVASGLFGTISGSPTSDVAATGSVTIPAMRADGYPAERAAAVEVAASTGGSILPPVMGTASFIMAEYTGAPYSHVILAALIPALLYYGALWLGIALDSGRYGSRAACGQTGDTGESGQSGEPPSAWAGVIVVLAGGVLVAALASGLLPSMAAMAASAVALAAGLVLPGLRKGPRLGRRLGLGDLVRIIDVTARRLMPVLAACLLAGVLIGCVTMTGLSGKAAWLVVSAGQGLMAPTLVLAALAALIFGMGMPTTGAYILGATLLAPALVELGIATLTAHFFVFYFAVLSAMTPPLAVAAFTAVAISGGRAYRVGLSAMRYGVAAFLLPFAFVLHEGLLMQGTTATVAADTIRAATGLAAIVYGLEGGGLRAMAPSPRQRLAAIAAGLLILTPHALLTSVGVLVLVAAVADRLRATGPHEVSRRTE
ncbi:MAG: TRAP transporter fused permease subunit [Pseudomonadota bacterium]